MGFVRNRDWLESDFFAGRVSGARGQVWFLTGEGRAVFFLGRHE